MLRIYGASDDLVEIEGDRCDEIGGSNVKIRFDDGTSIRVKYSKPNLAVWSITVEKSGSSYQKLVECNDENAEIYSDIFEIDADITSYRVIS